MEKEFTVSTVHLKNIMTIGRPANWMQKWANIIQFLASITFQRISLILAICLIASEFIPSLFMVLHEQNHFNIFADHWKRMIDGSLWPTKESKFYLLFFLSQLELTIKLDIIIHWCFSEVMNFEINFPLIFRHLFKSWRRLERN